MGDLVSQGPQLKTGAAAHSLATSSFRLSAALLKDGIRDAARVKLLRRFLASMLPSEGAQLVGEGSARRRMDPRMSSPLSSKSKDF